MQWRRRSAQLRSWPWRCVRRAVLAYPSRELSYTHDTVIIVSIYRKKLERLPLTQKFHCLILTAGKRAWMSVTIASIICKIRFSVYEPVWLTKYSRHNVQSPPEMKMHMQTSSYRRSVRKELSQSKAGGG